MSDQKSKTEKPTPRRLQKARKDGNFPTSKDFVGALQFTLFVALMGAYAADWLDKAELYFRYIFQEAFRGEFRPADMLRYSSLAVSNLLAPLGIGGAVIFVSTLAIQLVSTRFGMSLKSLQPSLKRLNPISRLKELPSKNIPAAIQALLMLLVFGWAIYALARSKVDVLLLLPLVHLDSGLATVAVALQDLFWKGAGCLLVFGCVDFVRQHRRHHQKLLMSRQELRDEMKETEGDPHIKVRMRGIRRTLLRRQMMNEIPNAAAVIVNPTHYAVALKYDHGEMLAPIVVAKGRNYLAKRIREIAIENSVPLVENPPLARALFKSVEVGQQIPPNLYKAIAEVLAYIYRLRQIH